MTSKRNQRLEQGIATRAALTAAGRKLFAEKGYHATGTEDLVAMANVTRGALYHHFKDKEALFEAVFQQIAAELFAAASVKVGALQADRWNQLQIGLQVHLQIIAQSPEIQRVLLVDGPSVFGWAKWRELQAAFSLGALVLAMEDLIDAGVLKPLAPLVAAQMLQSALNEAALLIAHAEDAEAARLQVGEALQAMVSGLRQESASADIESTIGANAGQGSVRTRS